MINSMKDLAIILQNWLYVIIPGRKALEGYFYHEFFV
jgi:hypothetical protein